MSGPLVSTGLEAACAAAWAVAVMISSSRASSFIWPPTMVSWRDEMSRKVSPAPVISSIDSFMETMRLPTASSMASAWVMRDCSRYDIIPNSTIEHSIKAPKVASTTMPLMRCLLCDSTKAAAAACISPVWWCMSAAAFAAMPAARFASSAESSIAERMATMSASSLCKSSCGACSSCAPSVASAAPM